MQIQQKTAFVTGAASGLGLAAARRLHAEGARLMMFDLNAEQLAEQAAKLGPDVLWAAGDVCSEDQVKAALDKALTAFGALHFNINCAGVGTAAKTVGRDGPMPLEQFARVVQINLIGTFNVLRLCATAMTKNTSQNEDGERGVIVNVASVAAWDGQVGQAAYSASKAGIVGMTLPIARDLAREGVRVMTIAPGIFETPLLQASPEVVRQSLIDMVQFPKRLGQPDEFADMVVHILQCAYLNGESIRLDAGIRMQPR